MPGADAHACTTTVFPVGESHDPSVRCLACVRSLVRYPYSTHQPLTSCNQLVASSIALMFNNLRPQPQQSAACSGAGLQREMSFEVHPNMEEATLNARFGPSSS